MSRIVLALSCTDNLRGTAGDLKSNPYTARIRVQIMPVVRISVLVALCVTSNG